jgi:iron complex outermembrane receptor protein
MKRLQVLKSALVGGASALALVHPAAAKVFDIPGGDLATALSTYMQQSGVDIVYVGDVVRGHHSRGARGDYTETAALTQILSGTGFTTQSVSSSAIGIVPQPPKPVERLAQAARRAPAAPMPAESTGIETVVVTAQHKSENIQQVPIAVTALSQQQLTERQIAGGPDLVKEVPNLTFSKTNFTGYNLEIRGIGTQAISVTTDPAVAVAFNDIPFIRNHFFEQEFFDLGDLEVLRGPQGTLYGRNATAGVVNIVSAKPTDTYEAIMSADFGNYNNRRLEGMLNLPIVGDTLDLRIAGEWTKRDGYSTDTTYDMPVDGRDLWSGRMTLGWKPASNVQAWLVWEHFSEDDDRLRSGKQLCKQAPYPAEVGGVLVPPPGGDQMGSLPGADYLSQGCEDTSLYSPDAYEVPNPYSLPYYAGPLFGADEGKDGTTGQLPYSANEMQSTNLRQIQSQILPTYRAKNDTLEYNADWTISSGLTFTSQTGYNNDFLWSTEDFNRFGSAPGFFLYTDAAGTQRCEDCIADPALGSFGGNPEALYGIACDPQLGCSASLEAEDLSEERAWQASQEFRLASNFAGPLNFSLGGNYLHYETVEDYYVFINSVTMLSYYNQKFPISTPGANDDSNCLPGGYRYPNPSIPREFQGNCVYVDTNPIGSLNNQGHNYFLSQNPYVLNSYATFGELYYNIAQDLKLTTGLRWTIDQKHFLDIPSEILVGGYGYAVTGIVNQHWSEPTGRVALDWTPNLAFTDQTLFYASVAHGYKAGGANPPGAIYPVTGQAGGIESDQTADPIHPLTFKPEYIEAFELGTKNTLLDGSLTANGDIFYYNYTGYQISEIEDRTAINLNFNAHVEGAELEANWEPLPGLKFGLAQGIENTRLAGGDEAVDLIDRTAGNPNWVVVKPFLTEASNCILPAYVVAALIEQGSSGATLQNACDETYSGHLDPITNLPYVPNPTVVGPINGTPGGIPPGYPGYDPLAGTPGDPYHGQNTYNGINYGPVPNNGGGFDKNVGGNQLPNAPHFTTSFTAEYTMPVSDDWAATLHGDFYWQSQQWARVFNDPIDKIHPYSNVNLSLILTSANGWQVMGYVKNVFDVTAITGTFLNSDDTGLTTNVFLTDPRLYGVRVTKQLDENDGFWGSAYNGSDLIAGLFSDADHGKPPLWIELGGQFDFLDNSQQSFSPPFMPSIIEPRQLKALNDQRPPLYGIDETAKISYEPDGSDWVFSMAVRYGRSSANRNEHQQTPNVDVKVLPFTVYGFQEGGYDFYPDRRVKFADGLSQQSERHTILDFLVGKDVGLGMFGIDGSSIVSGGIRVAQFVSKSNVNLNALPDLQYPTGSVANQAQKYQFKRSKMRFHDYQAMAEQKESFHGLGPELAWNASAPVAGNDTDNGEIALDWGANFSVLFGRQTARGNNKTSVNSYYLNNSGTRFNHIGTQSRGTGAHRLRIGFFTGPCTNRDLGGTLGICKQQTHSASHNRSRMVAVPNLGALFGLSYKYQNAKVSFGYSADEFFGAMDGGIDTRKSENVGFFGPFANISIGLGG